MITNSNSVYFAKVVTCWVQEGVLGKGLRNPPTNVAPSVILEGEDYE